MVTSLFTDSKRFLMSHPPQPSRTVTGRYRRAPAAWLWLALLLLPLLLALLSWFLFDRPESPQEPAPGAATSMSSPGQTPTSTETATFGTPAAAPAPIDIRSDEQELIVDAVVPDEAARANLLETAQAAAGDREVIDQITVTPGQPVTDPAGLSGLLDDATDRFQTFGIHLTPTRPF